MTYCCVINSSKTVLLSALIRVILPRSKYKGGGYDMVIVYGFAALLGGLVSCALLWPYGAAIAFLSMPFGGSLFVLITAILVYMRASDEARPSVDRAVYADQPQKLQTTESHH